MARLIFQPGLFRDIAMSLLAGEGLFDPEPIYCAEREALQLVVVGGLIGRPVVTAALRIGDLVVRGMLVEGAVLGLQHGRRGGIRAGQRAGTASGEGDEGSKEESGEGGFGKGLHRLVFLVSLIG